MPNWSWTRLNVLNDCELQHDLKYQQKVKGKSKQDIYLVGRVVHKVVERWARGGYDDNEIESLVKEALHTELKNLNRSDANERAKMLQRAATAAYTAAELYRKLKLPEHGAIIEEQFSVPYSGHDRLAGAPDAYDPVEKLIVDLKTQQTGHGKKGQLYTYAWFEQMQGREVTGGVFVYPLQTVKLEYLDITQDNIDQQAQQYREAPNRNGKKATKGDHCFFCDYGGTSHCTLTFRRSNPGFVRFDDARAPKSAEGKANGAASEESSPGGGPEAGN